MAIVAIVVFLVVFLVVFVGDTPRNRPDARVGQTLPSFLVLIKKSHKGRASRDVGARNEPWLR